MSQALILSILVLFWGLAGLLAQGKTPGPWIQGFILYLGVSLLLGTAASFFLSSSLWKSLFFAGGLGLVTGTALVLGRARKKVERESPAESEGPPLNLKLEIKNFRDLVKVVKAAQIYLEEGSAGNQALIFLFALVVFLLIGLTK